MLPINSQSACDRLLEFQRAVRTLLIDSRKSKPLFSVARESCADTIYQIDTVVEPLLEDFCREWAKTTPLILIAEGIEDKCQSQRLRTLGCEYGQGFLFSPPLCVEDAETLLANWRPAEIAALGDRVSPA